jgi:sugar lactone lactonase YvrE
MLDIMEHGGHGRVLEYNPATKQATTVVSGLDFANGIAISHDQNWVLVNETGTYRVLRVGITDLNKGQVETVIENLPGFPDNISRGSNNIYWVGLVSPRSAALDALSGSGFLRKVVQRLPQFLQPKAKHFGHIIAINDQGEVVHNLQDPLGMYGHTTGAIEVGADLYVSSLHDTALGKTVNINIVIEK